MRIEYQAHESLFNKVVFLLDRYVMHTVDNHTTHLLYKGKPEYIVVWMESGRLEALYCFSSHVFTFVRENV